MSTLTKARLTEVARDAAWNLKLAAKFLLNREGAAGFGESWTMVSELARQALDAIGEGDAMIGDLTPHICKDHGPGAAQGLCWYCCARVGPRHGSVEATR